MSILDFLGEDLDGEVLVRSSGEDRKNNFPGTDRSCRLIKGLVRGIRWVKGNVVVLQSLQKNLICLKVAPRLVQIGIKGISVGSNGVKNREIGKKQVRKLGEEGKASVDFFRYCDFYTVGKRSSD